MPDAHNTHWMSLSLVDDCHNSDVTESRLVTLRDQQGVILPRSVSANTPYRLSQIAPNRLYLREHMSDLLPLVRRNMDLTPEPLGLFGRLKTILIGLLVILMVLAIDAFVVTHLVTIFQSQPNPDFGDLISQGEWVFSLLVVSLGVIFGLGIIWMGLKPAQTQEALETTKQLIAEGQLICCEAELTTKQSFQSRTVYISYQIPNGEKTLSQSYLNESHDSSLRRGMILNVLVLFLNDVSVVL